MAKGNSGHLAVQGCSRQPWQGGGRCGSDRPQNPRPHQFTSQPSLPVHDPRAPSIRPRTHAHTLTLPAVALLHPWIPYVRSWRIDMTRREAAAASLHLCMPNSDPLCRPCECSKVALDPGSSCPHHPCTHRPCTMIPIFTPEFTDSAAG
jgi:hypothetical protein